MTCLLVRDDDANATTDPQRLARAFDPLLQAHIPIHFAVIPEVDPTTLGPDGHRERFLDSEMVDPQRSVPSLGMAPIAGWLHRVPEAHILQHGFSHGRRRGGTEFGALGSQEAEPLVAQGKTLLENALNKPVEGFVAPWDALSRGSLRAITRVHEFVSTSFLDRRRLPPLAWPAHFLERLRRSEALRVGPSWVLRHRGGLVQPTLAPEDVPQTVRRLTAGATVGVVVLHHWMFWDRVDPHPVIRALASTLQNHRCVTAREALHHLARPSSRTPKAFGHRPPLEGVVP